MIGANRKRLCCFSGNRLVLSAASPLPAGVKEWTIVWERVGNRRIGYKSLPVSWPAIVPAPPWIVSSARSGMELWRHMPLLAELISLMAALL